MTQLVKITITKRPDGLWDCTRERKEGEGGESAGGMKSLKEVFDYIRAHETVPDGEEATPPKKKPFNIDDL